MNYSYTVAGLKESLSKAFNDIGLDVSDLNIEIPSQDDVTQKDPWHIIVKADIEYYFKDNSKIASWKGFTTRTANVSVYGLYDPYSKKIITSDWYEDKPEYTEPSMVNKLSGYTTVRPLDWKLGICPPINGCDTS
jgi:hypothetical protein